MINVLYCGDKNVLNGLIISTLSLAKQTSQPLNIFVLTMKMRGFKEMPQKSIKKLDALLKEKNPKHQVQLIDITEEFQSDPPKANVKNLFSPYCLLRLYADLVPELPSKILYLDTDVVALGDPYELYKMDNSKYELMGAVDYYGQHWIRTNLFEKTYMNSGVLLMNLDMIRDTGLLKKTRKRVRHVKMMLPDQTSLNMLSKHKLLIDRKFNEQKQETDETIFRHFSNTFRFWPVFHVQKIKPWDIDKVHDILRCHTFDDVLDEYQKVKKYIAKWKRP